MFLHINYERKKQMLELKNIVKEYKTGDNVVSALSGVSLCFRENEFVSILGPSGCGKTTLLNIVGGLDRYTHGDLIINGKSTKLFRDGDWDAYRNHSVGFVFQSYNLIPHQTVLANVELALTLSGVSKSERRAKAVEALKKVGLGDQLHKKPNQMSGGQMQRVAIARALVNNPDILLADEPTGALDTQTSVQIMDLLKEVANDRLVIMVTHNPDLAAEYSTRIVKLSDGVVIDDSNPVTPEEYEKFVEKDKAFRARLTADKKAQKALEKKKSMSFATAVSLSLKNLLTKKGRTVLTSLAGSIGIIGIALILALSNGIQMFIDQVQEDTLSTYPLTIQKQTQDSSAMLEALTQTSEMDTEPDPNKIYVDNSLDRMVSALTSTVQNDLVSFKKYIDDNYDSIEKYLSDVQYTYSLDMQVFSADGNTKIGLASMLDHMGEAFAGMSSMFESSGMSGMDVFSEMINNQDLLDQQYEIVKGNWPASHDEVVLVVGRNNQISKMTLYMLGMLPQDELDEIMSGIMGGEKYESEDIPPFSTDDFIGMTFKLVNTYDFFEKTDKTYTNAEGKVLPVWNDIRDDVKYLSDEKALAEFVKEHGTDLKISGIIRPRVDATSTSISGAIGYTKALTDKMLESNAASELIKQQKSSPEYNALTGLKIERTKYTPETIGDLIDKIDDSTMAQFYALATPQIKQSQEFAALMNVTKETLIQVFFIMPEASRAEILADMLASAKTNNPTELAILCGALTQIRNSQITFTPDNLLTLTQIMTPQELGFVIVGGGSNVGTGMPLKGLIDLASETDMSAIYTKASTVMQGMTLNEEIMKMALPSLKADSEVFIQLEEMLYSLAPQIDATHESILKQLGDAEKAAPASINFYAKDFDSKAEIEAFIADYNASLEADGKEPLQYSDLVGALMSSVSIIIDVISYVLIAFVSISLVVSSIMIGIITNISVLERTKEIGILRAIGASKKDISRVFNAETFIIGLAAGIFGILLTLLFCIPVNAIVQGLSGFSNIKAVLPVVAAVILIMISMILTIVAGLIPAKSASNKDPVIALRTE